MVLRRFVVAVVVLAAAAAGQAPTESSPSSRSASRPTRELRVALASGAPAAGAEVRYLAASFRDGRRAFLQLLSKNRSSELPVFVESLFADAWASEARADYDGRFTVPASELVLVAARHRNQAGFEVFDSVRDAAADILTMAPVVVLRTLDAAGNPAPSVPVMRTRTLGNRTRNSDLAGRTNADGSLRFFAPPPERGDDPAAWSVAAYPLGADPVTAPLDDEEPPATIELRLPPLGSLRVVVTGLDGTPCDVPVDVSVSVSKWNDARRGGTWDTDPAGIGELEDRSAADGSVEFANVALGKSYLVVCRSSKRPDWADARGVVEGPRGAGETATATFALGAPRLTVRARFVADEYLSVLDGHAELKLLDEDGRPIAAPSATAHPSTTGHVVFSFGLAADSRPRRAIAKWRFNAGFETKDPPDVEIPSFAADAAGNVDLGDVVFRGLPVLAGGLVVDERGAPISGAGVELQTARADGSYDDRNADLGFVGARTAADGSFALRGRVSTPAATASRPSRRLVVTASGFVGSTAPCTFGDEVHKIALRRAGSVAAKFRFDVGRDTDFSVNDARGIRPRFFLGVRGTPAAPLADAEGVAWVVADADGKARLDGLAPGVARVEAWILDGDRPFLAVDDVRIVAGEIAAPPALQDVDVGKLLPKALLRVVDERGAPIVGARVFALRAKHDFWSETHVGRDGEASTYVGATPMAVVVAADGRWARETTLGAGRLDVMLPSAGSGATVRARVENAAEAVAAGLRLTLRPERFDPRAAPGDSSFARHPVNGELRPADAAPNAEGRASFRLFTAGSWRLTATAEVGPSGLQWIELGSAATTTAFDVVEREAVYDAVVRIDVAAAVRAVREAEKR